MNRYTISTPEGTQDRLFQNCKNLRKTEYAIREVLENRNYSEIITPAIEYYDVFNQAGTQMAQEKQFKVIDRSGRICVMRPDNTAPIARVAATKLSDFPVRLYYCQNVYRADDGNNGRSTEILQIGAELLGEDGINADLDILTSALTSLTASGLKDFRIELGHADIYKGLISSLGMELEEAEEIRGLIENKSFAALGEVLEPFKGSEAYDVLCAMPQLFGGVEVLDTAESMTQNTQVREAISYLREIFNSLCEAGFENCVMIDLGLVHSMDYYTGLMFRGYTGGAGISVLSGGRYNALCGKFGESRPATGFAIDLETVAEIAQTGDKSSTVGSDIIRIALTKGRLEKKTLELLRASGYDVSELLLPSRKLIFRLPNSNIELVLAKAADVITYVEHGVCDMGVVGKDTIMEKGGSFYEMVDLGFGKCRFALATEKNRDFWGGYKTHVIATKYPEVTRQFFAKKHLDVETIKIEGSVELAPLMGLADAIVDIVETGSTLKENGLEVIEDVAPISARVIVNIASAKLKKAYVQKTISELEGALGR